MICFMLLLCIFGGGNGCQHLEPDVSRNVTQLITSKGYLAEEYDVQTPDGYILGIQRIPRGRKGVKESKGVVFLQHGLGNSAVEFVLNLANQSLAFILADEGYDVWMGNNRGNIYSRRHVKLSPDSDEFWNFSQDEIAALDLPAMMNFVLEKTGQKNLYYIGHSQGTHVAFALLSESPEFNKKIRLFAALAPVAMVEDIKGPLRYLAPAAVSQEAMYILFGRKEFLPTSDMTMRLAELFCNTPFRALCENVVFLVIGADSKQMNSTRIPVYLGHLQEGASVKNYLHYGQLVDSKTFRKFDYGSKENQRRYGQATPPDYKVENISTPVGLFWSLNDWLADPTDVARLKPRIKNLALDYKVPDASWTHIDFAIAMEAKSAIYDPLLDLLKKY